MLYPWIHGINPYTSQLGYQSSVQTDGGPPTNSGVGSTFGPEQTGGSGESGGMNPHPNFFNADRGNRSNTLNVGVNTYPTSPGFFPYPILAAGGRPEPGDPLYTTNVDGPELKLISHQLMGPDNYVTWSRELWRALVTKNKEGFLDGTIPVPTNERGPILEKNVTNSSELGSGIVSQPKWQ